MTISLFPPALLGKPGHWLTDPDQFNSRHTALFALGYAAWMRILFSATTTEKNVKIRLSLYRDWHVSLVGDRDCERFPHLAKVVAGLNTTPPPVDKALAIFRNTIPNFFELGPLKEELAKLDKDQRPPMQKIISKMEAWNRIVKDSTPETLAERLTLASQWDALSMQDKAGIWLENLDA